MPAGVLIAYKGRKSKFWYPCGRDAVRDKVADHHRNWKTEQVAVGGEEVTREVPLSDLVVTYCQGFKKNERGEDEMVNPEVIDAVKLLGG